MREIQLSPAFFRDEEIGECDPATRLLLLGLWSMADSSRLVYRHAGLIRNVLFQDRDVGLWNAISDLQQLGYLEVYSDRHWRLTCKRDWELAIFGKLTSRRKGSHRRRAAVRNVPVNDLEPDVWNAILEMFGHRCAYCLADGVPLEIEHMQPISRGGSHTASNVVPACESCNSRKGYKTLVEFAGGLKVGRA